MGDDATLPAGNDATAALRHCRTCGYDIHWLAPDATCPECGTPVALSRASYLLADAEPAWLGRIARGLRIIQWSVLIVKVAIVVIAFVAFTSMTTRFQSPLTPWIPRILIVIVIALAASMMVAMIGSLLITESDPRDSYRTEPFWPRRALRLFSLMAIALWAIVVARLVASHGFTARMLAGPTTWTALLIIVLAMLAGVRLLRHVAERIPAPQYALTARRVEQWGRWLLPLPIICVTGTLVAAMAAPGLFTKPTAIVNAILTAIAVLNFVAPAVAIVPILGLGTLAANVAKAVRQIHRDSAGRAPPLDAGRGAAEASRGDARV